MPFEVAAAVPALCICRWVERDGEQRRISTAPDCPRCEPVDPFPTEVCRGCPQEIIWVVTEARKSMPVDAVPVLGGSLALSWLGRRGDREVRAVVIPEARRAGRRLYMSHFATCPHADRFRTKSAGRL